MSLVRYIAVGLMNAVGVLVGVVWVPIAHAQAQVDRPPSIAGKDQVDAINSYRFYKPDQQIDRQISSEFYHSTADFLMGRRETDNFAPAWERIETIVSQQNSDLTANPKSLKGLYQLQARLKKQLENTQTNSWDIFSDPQKYQEQLDKYEQLLKKLRSVEARIILEKKADKVWRKAFDQANLAVAAGKEKERNIETWQEAEGLWLDAINTLRNIPQGSFLTDFAIEKMIEYQGYLAVATYERVLLSRATPTVMEAKSVSPVPPAIAAPEVVGSSKNKDFNFYGDTNRDSILNDSDIENKAIWSLSQGALILFNNDDDDLDGQADWQDEIVNSEEDANDLAIVNLKLSPDYQGSQIYITADAMGGKNINVFQKTEQGWQPVDLSGEKPIEFSRHIILGVEAKQFAFRNWTGMVSLRAIAKKDGQEVALDAISMGVVPWLMSPNTAPVSDIYVSDRGSANREFIDKLKQIANKTGTNVQTVTGGPLWMQDSKKIGYVQFPHQGEIRNVNVVLKTESENQSVDSGKSLMKKDMGLFAISKDRELDPMNQWLDGYGNLAVTPPLPDFPLGRIYYGQAGSESLNPEVVEFIKAQKVQGSPVEIDLSWLMIRHVDEVISFLPGKSGKPVMLIVSPGAGVSLLQDLNKQGYGQAAINRGLSTQNTIRGTLTNERLIQHNLYLQREKIDPLLQKLKQEFKLKDNQIIQVPMLYGYSGYAWWPNLVKSVLINGELLASDPRGPLINQQDYFQENFRQLIAQSAVNINFIDDQYYQELQGDVGNAVNTSHVGIDSPFWSALSAPPGK
ncbi:MAG: protein-arginine deiminase family protein [Microcoleaceae cyanobacterium]